MACVALFLGGVSGCAHTVTVRSQPPGASISLNGKDLGVAPVAFDESMNKEGAHLLVARLNGHETTTLYLERSDYNPWSLFAATPCCGSLGWAAAAATLAGGVALTVPTLGCSDVIAPVPALALAGAGCGWVLLTSPTLLMLQHWNRLPGEVVITLPPTGQLQQLDEGLPAWPPPSFWTGDEDNYWQNPEPVLEDGGLPLPPLTAASKPTGTSPVTPKSEQ